jgi:RHS repeat-associated protein
MELTTYRGGLEKMPVVNYHSANGRLIGETTSGVRTDYMSDALGSVTGTLNASQAVVNTYRYKPYGELLAKTGSAADPAFMWNGTTQSRRTGLAFSGQYNRARHYGTRQGQWTTVDPLWPSERAFVYVSGNPVRWTDPSGRKIQIDSKCDKASVPRDCCQKYKDALLDKNNRLSPSASEAIKKCMSDKGFGDKAGPFIDGALRNFFDLCSGTGGNNNLCVKCKKKTGNDPYGSVIPIGCNICGPNVWASAFWPIEDGPIPIPDGCSYAGPPSNRDHPCAPLHNPSLCACTVMVCQTHGTPEGQCQTLFHESIHCGGVGGDRNHGTGPQNDVIFALTCCVCTIVNGKDSPHCTNCSGFTK